MARRAEWRDRQEGPERAHFLIQGLIAQARQEGIDIPYSATTEYVNTIPVERQPKYPGNADMEIRIHNYIRWNAMAMVVRANRAQQRRRPHRVVRLGGGALRRRLLVVLARSLGERTAAT
jgi:pyruvate dehydrogenase complex dehydrogenase (E1) component